MRTSLVLAVLLLTLPLAHASAQDLKAYQNYDFVPGDRILFEDDFASDQDGEFPAHWKLEAGQAVVNKLQGEPALLLTEGNYVKVAPRMKSDAYLGDTFTIEFDMYPKAGSYEKTIVFLRGKMGGDDRDASVVIGHDVSFEGAEHDLSATYRGSSDAYTDHWHHVAVAWKKGQMKVYEDQYRVLVVPDAADFTPAAVAFGGVGDVDNPLVFKNVRLAAGGDMNLIDKLTKDGRVVTHGILFDVNRSTLRPESQGTIGQIVKLMKDTPDLKLEVGGHTDNSGDATKNLTLSQARADAVRKALVDQGIDAARLTSKGYGATRPIDSNDTLEGKANNRRVEFTKGG